MPYCSHAARPPPRPPHPRPRAGLYPHRRPHPRARHRRHHRRLQRAPLGHPAPVPVGAGRPGDDDRRARFGRESPARPRIPPSRTGAPAPTPSRRSRSCAARARCSRPATAPSGCSAPSSPTSSSACCPSPRPSAAPPAGRLRSGAPPVVAISWPLWQRRFGGDRSVIGRSVTLGERSYTIVGVMPVGFAYPTWADLWAPITAILETIRRSSSGACMRTAASSAGSGPAWTRRRAYGRSPRSPPTWPRRIRRRTAAGGAWRSSRWPRRSWAASGRSSACSRRRRLRAAHRLRQRRGARAGPGGRPLARARHPHGARRRPRRAAPAARRGVRRARRGGRRARPRRCAGLLVGWLRVGARDLLPRAAELAVDPWAWRPRWRSSIALVVALGLAPGVPRRARSRRAPRGRGRRRRDRPGAGSAARWSWARSRSRSCCSPAPASWCGASSGCSACPPASTRTACSPCRSCRRRRGTRAPSAPSSSIATSRPRSRRCPASGRSRSPITCR